MYRADSEIDFSETVLGKAVREFARTSRLRHIELHCGWLHALLGASGSPEMVVAGFRFPLNSAAASAVARDKIVSSMLLCALDITSVAHASLQDAEFIGPVVTKPRNGTGGRGVTSWVSVDEARVAYLASTSELSEIACSPLLKFNSERRLVVLDDTIVLAYDKMPVEGPNNLSMHNLSLGASVVDLDTANLGQSEASLAIAGARGLGLRVASIDMIYDEQDQCWSILEVNDGIMLEWYARHSSTTYDNALRVYTGILHLALAAAIPVCHPRLPPFPT